MKRPTIHKFVDFSNVEAKRGLPDAYSTFTGLYEITFEPRQNSLSVKQRGWYFGHICELLGKFMTEQHYEHHGKDFAHRYLKKKFLQIETVDLVTGEIETVTGSIMKLDTAQMADYCERCRFFMLDMLGIITQDPDPRWRESKVKPEPVAV